jgi:hypothetical protein
MTIGRFTGRVEIVDDYTSDTEYTVSGGVWPSFSHWHIMITEWIPKQKDIRCPIICNDTFEQAAEDLGLWIDGIIHHRTTPLVLYVRTNQIRRWLIKNGAQGNND